MIKKTSAEDFKPSELAIKAKLNNINSDIPARMIDDLSANLARSGAKATLPITSALALRVLGEVATNSRDKVFGDTTKGDLMNAAAGSGTLGAYALWLEKIRRDANRNFAETTREQADFMARLKKNPGVLDWKEKHIKQAINEYIKWAGMGLEKKFGGAKILPMGMQMLGLWGGRGTPAMMWRPYHYPIVHLAGKLKLEEPLEHPLIASHFINHWGISGQEDRKFVKQMLNDSIWGADAANAALDRSKGVTERIETIRKKAVNPERAVSEYLDMLRLLGAKLSTPEAAAGIGVKETPYPVMYLEKIKQALGVMNKGMPPLSGALGAGAVGIPAYYLYKYLKSKDKHV